MPGLGSGPSPWVGPIVPQTDPESSGSPGRGLPPGTGPAVAYFAKVPRPGAVKTRLCPPLTPAEAAGLYRGFLTDVVRPVPGARTFCYVWPADGAAEVAALLPAGIEVRPQRGADLWERLRGSSAELFAAGHAPVLIRNTDSPDLPAACVEEALRRAGPGRVVLGPDAGGGYYLVALGEPCPQLFPCGGEERGATVYAETVARARGLGLAIEELEVHRDVDTFDDLLLLWAERRGGS